MLNIQDPEADRLARELASATGETLAEAVAAAVRERLERVRSRGASAGLAQELDTIARRASALPELDRRSPEEVLGYDADGLPS